MRSKKSVILIGGTGFVGRKIAALLVAKGYSVVLPTRSLTSVKPLLVLPSLKPVQMDVHDESQLKKLITQESSCVAVINLVGVLHDSPSTPYGKNFSKNHVELPRKVIAAMRQSPIRRLLHMSALGADSHGPSMYQRSKGDGEQLVKSSDLDWTIFRPSVIFGKDDNFINLFAKLLKLTPVMPLAGYSAKFQPVSVRDVAQVFVNALENPKTIHQSYDLCGPKVYRLCELVRFAGEMIGKQRLLIPLPNLLGYLQAFFIEKMPGPTLMSRDNVSSMLVDNILPTNSPNAIREVFGIEPEPLESLL